MNVDDIVKLLLAIAISFSLVGISYEIMRLIGKLADGVQDLRKAVQNLSTASDMVLDDYNQIRKLLHVLIDIIENFEENVLSPIKMVSKLLQKVGGNKRVEADDTEEDDL